MQYTQELWRLESSGITMALSQVYFYLYQYKPIFTLLFLNFFKISIGTRENNTNSTLDFFSDSLFFIASKLLKSTSQVKIYIMYAQVHKRVCERESRLMHFSSAFCTFFFLFFFFVPCWCLFWLCEGCINCMLCCSEPKNKRGEWEILCRL